MVIVAALLVVLALAAHADGATLEGRVIDREEMAPVSLAVVSVDDTAQVETDDAGRFRLAGLPVGVVPVRVEHVGYTPWSREIQLSEEQTTEIVVRLDPRVETLETVEVSTNRPDPVVTQGKRTIPPMQIRRGAGTVATDLLRSVQALPGAAAAGDDFSNRYVVRGGDPEENLVLIDGYTLLQPIHLEGFTSVIYDDLIRSVEVYPGAVPPRYGDALSSITALAMVDPAITQRFFRYDLGSIALGAQGRGANLSALAAVRTSFYNLILRRPPGISKRGFQDFSTKLSLEHGPMRTSLTSVLSRDREEGDYDRAVDGILVGLRTERLAGDRRWRVALTYGSRNRTTIGHHPPSEVRGDFDRASASAGFSWDLATPLQVRFDIEARHEQFEDLQTIYRSNGMSLSAEGTCVIDRVGASLGGRIERIPFTETYGLSPYISVRLHKLGRFSPSAGWRILRQSPFHLTETPEVAGLPVDPGELLEAGAQRVDPLQAEHISIGCDTDLGRGYAAIVEGYQKRYRRLLTWGPEGPTAEGIENSGNGIGRGIELTLRKAAGKRWSGWFSLSFSKTEKREGPAVTSRPADYDRPRMFQSACEIPIRGATTLSFAYRLASGRRITPLIATGNGEMIPGSINSEKLPEYRRLDLKLEHRFSTQKNDAFLYVDLLNLMNRANTVDIVQFIGAGGEVVRIRTQGVRILPIAGFGLYF